MEATPTTSMSAGGASEVGKRKFTGFRQNGSRLSAGFLSAALCLAALVCLFSFDCGTSPLCTAEASVVPRVDAGMPEADTNSDADHSENGIQVDGDSLPGDAEAARKEEDSDDGLVRSSMTLTSRGRRQPLGGIAGFALTRSVLARHQKTIAAAAAGVMSVVLLAMLLKMGKKASGKPTRKLRESPSTCIRNLSERHNRRWNVS